MSEKLNDCVTNQDDRLSDYFTFWNNQSNLLWSRLQTISLIHSGALAAWYVVRNEWFADYLVYVAILLTAFIALIMFRDAQYMDAARAKIGNAFPTPKCDLPLGRIGALAVILVLCISEAVFLARYSKDDARSETREVGTRKN